MSRKNSIKNIYFEENGIQYLEVVKLSKEKVFFVIDKEYIDFMKTKLWYAMYCPKRRSHYLESRDKIKYHRYITNCPDDMVVDHINRNTYDNRLSNLKVCTVKENNQNRTIGKNQRKPKDSNTGTNYISYYSNGAGTYYYVVTYKGNRKRFKTKEGAIMYLDELKERVEV